MAATAVSHRRRGITYGRTHRRGFRDAAFAAEFPSQRENAEASDHTLAAAKIPQLSDSIAERPREVSSAFPVESTSASRASSESSRLLSSDDESTPVLTGTSSYIARKRRKITPARSIANSPTPLDLSPSPAMKTKGTTDQKLWHGQHVEPDLGDKDLRGRNGTVKKRGLSKSFGLAGSSQVVKTSEPSIQRSTHSRMTSRSSRSSQARLTPPSISSPKQSPQPQRLLRTSDTRPNASHPVTPPRPVTISQGPRTTPQQSVLWTRLLSPGHIEQSPSQLKVAELGLDDDRGFPAAKHVRLSPHKQSAQDKDLHRPRRVIDSLLESQSDGQHPLSSLFNDRYEHQSSPESLSETEKSLEDMQGDSSEPLLQEKNDGNKSLQVGMQDNSTNDLNPAYHSRGTRVTYAQQRTYLTDNSSSDQLPLYRTGAESGLSLENVVKGPLGFPRPGQGTEYDFEEDENGQSGTMRSIRELREAGGNTRLAGELEVCLDELDGHQAPIAHVRTSLIRLATKLHDASRARLFVDKGLEIRLVKYLGMDHPDLLVKSLVAAVFLQLLAHNESPSQISLLNSVQAKDFFCGILNDREDLKRASRLRHFNLSKVVAQDYDNFCRSLLSNTYWKPLVPRFLSCQAIGLQCLRHLIERRQNVKGVFSKSQMHNLLHSTALQETLSTDLASNGDFSNRQSLYIIGTTVAGTEHEVDHLFDNEDLKYMMNFLSFFGSDSLDAADIQIHVLHLCLNLAQRTSFVAEGLGRSDAASILIGFVISFFDSVRDNHRNFVQTALNRTILSLLCLMTVAEQYNNLFQARILQDQGGKSELDKLIEAFIENRSRVGEVRLLCSLLPQCDY